jgi:hypothetical protein
MSFVTFVYATDQTRFHGKLANYSHSKYDGPLDVYIKGLLLKYLDIDSRKLCVGVTAIRSVIPGRPTTNIPPEDERSKFDFYVDFANKHM